MSRQDCEKKLKEEGDIGNFVIRINANGRYILSLWWVYLECSKVQTMIIV